LPLAFATHTLFCYEQAPSGVTSEKAAEHYRTLARNEYGRERYQLAQRYFEQAINAAQNLAAARPQYANSAKETQARSLVGVGGCKIAVFEYRDALRYSAEGKNLALEIKKEDVAGAAAANLSTIYYQLGDLRLAEREADDAVKLLDSAEQKPDSNSSQLSPILLSHYLIRRVFAGKTRISQARKLPTIGAFKEPIRPDPSWSRTFMKTMAPLFCYHGTLPTNLIGEPKPDYSLIWRASWIRLMETGPALPSTMSIRRNSN
jgi:tetratricopeptide (TPR) repeat protein